MNTNLLTIVNQIAAQHGEAILADPKRLKAVFSDLAKNDPKPLRLAFGRAIEAGAYTALKTAPDTAERASRKASIAQRLRDEHGLDAALCTEALDILDAALLAEQPYKAAASLPTKSAAQRNKAVWYALAAALVAVAAAGIIIAARRTPSLNTGEYSAIMTMKERVKAAGGNVDGTLRFSIQWNEGAYNPNDFDAHCVEPDKNQINFHTPDGHRSDGSLDVDIINPVQGLPAVENITWPSAQKMLEGNYTFYVHCYSDNGGRNGFSAEIEYAGQIYTFTHAKPLREDESVLVAVVNYSRKDGFKLIKSMDKDTQITHLLHFGRIFASQKPGYPLQLQAAARRPLGYSKAQSALWAIFAAGRNAKLKNRHGGRFLSQFRF
jgi:hypothetical protein